MPFSVPETTWPGRGLRMTSIRSLPTTSGAATTIVCEFPAPGKRPAAFARGRIKNLSRPPRHLAIPRWSIVRESIRPFSSSSRQRDEFNGPEQGTVE
jgi:hypothetical protein